MRWDAFLLYADRFQIGKMFTATSIHTKVLHTNLLSSANGFSVTGVVNVNDMIIYIMCYAAPRRLKTLYQRVCISINIYTILIWLFLTQALYMYSYF